MKPTAIAFDHDIYIGSGVSHQLVFLRRLNMALKNKPGMWVDKDSTGPLHKERNSEKYYYSLYYTTLHFDYTIVRNGILGVSLA